MRKGIACILSLGVASLALAQPVWKLEIITPLGRILSVQTLTSKGLLFNSKNFREAPSEKTVIYTRSLKTPANYKIKQSRETKAVDYSGNVFTLRSLSLGNSEIKAVTSDGKFFDIYVTTNNSFFYKINAIQVKKDNLYLSLLPTKHQPPGLIPSPRELKLTRK